MMVRDDMTILLHIDDAPHISTVGLSHAMLRNLLVEVVADEWLCTRGSLLRVTVDHRRANQAKQRWILLMHLKL